MLLRMLDDTRWMVFRTDDAGRNYLVRQDMTEARALEADLAARGHKQAYTAYPYTFRSHLSVLRTLGIAV